MSWLNDSRVLPLATRYEYTWLTPLDPEYKSLKTNYERCANTWQDENPHQVCPASEIPVAIGTAWPSALYTAEMGPALMFAIQIMISFTFEPPGEYDVNRS
jgi:hypothetical protein